MIQSKVTNFYIDIFIYYYIVSELILGTEKEQNNLKTDNDINA